jgi:hypothetical protein
MYHPSQLLKWALLLAICCVYSPLTAAPKADDDAPVAEGPAADPAKPKDEAPDPDDEKLLKAVEPAAKHSMTDDADRLDRAVHGMWNAKKRIAASDTGHKTQEIQDQVVKDLEELLALLKKQQNRQSSQQKNQDQNSGKNQPPNQRQKVQKNQGDPQNSGAKKNPDSNDPQNGRRDSEKSRDSQERTDPARSAAAEEARRAQMIKDAWGHLPPHLREAMQNAFSEKYLPKYEDLVKKYYEALAEKNRQHGTSRQSDRPRSF